MLDFFFHYFGVFAEFFFRKKNSKKSFRNTIKVSNGLDPDQDQRFVGPDLHPNCLQSYQHSPPAKEEFIQSHVSFI